MVAADSKDTDPGLSWLMHVETPPIPLRIVPGLEVLILGSPDGVEANTADDVYGSRDWAALLQMRAMLAFKELPRDFSLIYFNINGVISFPDILRFVAASETASSVALSIAAASQEQPTTQSANTFATAFSESHF
jgi:hypothetical protein